MLKKTIISLLLVASTIASGATEHSIKGIVRDAKDKTVLPGANILVLNTTTGTVSDSNGEFELITEEHPEKLLVTFIGYKSDTITITSHKPITVFLKPELALKEVTVTDRRVGSHIVRLEPVHSEHLTEVELGKAACCTLAESFETNATVDVSHSDAVSGAKQIKMLGLAGKYVQITTEKLPSVRGVPGRFGLDYIPGPWMSSINVSKGTSSVIDGYESLTGQINIELKKPETSNPLFFNAFASGDGRYETNIAAAHTFSEKLSTILLTHTSYNNVALDLNNDQFLDMPLIRRFSATNKWDYINKRYMAHYTLNVLDERRESGNLDWINNSENEMAYGIKNATSMYGISTKQAIITNPLRDASVAALFSANRTQSNAQYGDRPFVMDEDYIYLNLIYQSKIFNPFHGITAGINGTFRNLDEQSAFFNNRFSEHTSGVFLEYSYIPSEKFVTQIGLRYDYNYLFNKPMYTPRAHIKYEVTDNLHARLSAGRGYRTPTLLSDNSGFFASSRELILQGETEIEASVNFGGSLTWYFTSFFNSTLTVDFFRTNFDNKLVIDLDSDPNKAILYNLKDQAFSDALQAEYKFEPLKNLETKIAYRYNNVEVITGGRQRIVPLLSRHKGLFNISYQTLKKSWQFDFTTQFSSGGRMPDPDEMNPLWDSSFDSYYTMNAQITRYFDKWEVYLGSENITNFRINNPIIGSEAPYGNTFDASMIWGPVMGRTIYLGLRFNII